MLCIRLVKLDFVMETSIHIDDFYCIRLTDEFIRLQLSLTISYHQDIIKERPHVCYKL